ALEYKISQQQFRNRGGVGTKSRIGVRGEVSNYAKKLQEMTDYHLYGIRESRRMVTTVMGKEVDFTQLFSRITGYIAKLNLGYNVIADATSYTTGLYNNLIDAS